MGYRGCIGPVEDKCVGMVGVNLSMSVSARQDGTLGALNTKCGNVLAALLTPSKIRNSALS